MSFENLDHPCKETCSGWKQGYEKGLKQKIEYDASRERAIEGMREALVKYQNAFQTIEAQLNIRPELLGVWRRQMEFILGEAPKALAAFEKVR